MKKIDKLKSLYLEVSKHSGYQILPNCISSIVGENGFNIKSRYENERLKYILSKINVIDKTVLDVGGNTGFFTFELIDNGATSVHYYEGNKTHANFVKFASDFLGMNNEIEITNGYFTFRDELKNKIYDIAILLNVLHHFGDDYGDNQISIEEAKFGFIEQLNRLAGTAKILVFQFGYNWKGNTDFNLFKHGSKKEMIRFIKKGIQNKWEILKIGVAEYKNDKIKYCDLNNKNICRFDVLGEFLNRPIFILKSLV